MDGHVLLLVLAAALLHATWNSIVKGGSNKLFESSMNALGGGLELALCCDIRLCSETAKFGQPEVGLGITPGFGGTQRLPRVVGTSNAMTLTLTGKPVGAEDALRMRLVNRVYPDAELMSSPIVPAPITAILSSIIVRHSPLNSALGRFARKAVMALS